MSDLCIDCGGQTTSTDNGICRDCTDRGDYEGDDGYCLRCDSQGTILVCPDDICHGAGECFHGDGTVVCPDCKGESAW